jgi:hypothetical protein
MSGKIVCLGGLALALLGLVGAACGQGPNYPASPTATLPSEGSGLTPSPPLSLPYSGPHVTDGGAGGGGPWNGTSNAPGQVDGAMPNAGTGTWSSWIHGPRDPGCCGPAGGDGPLGYELYARSGVSVPIGGGIFNDVLHPGWSIEGGGRLLLFNQQADAAWTVDLSVSNTHYNGKNGGADHTFTLVNVPAQGKVGVQIGNMVIVAANAQRQNIVIDSITGFAHAYNETLANGRLGHEWYLLGSAGGCNGGVNWRWGIDAGGGFGSGRADLRYTNPNLTTVNGGLAGTGQAVDPASLFIRHQTRTIKEAAAAIHSDIEIPCGCCLFQAGIRVEYGYVWSNILQPQNNADLHSINVLFQLGARF